MTALPEWIGYKPFTLHEKMLQEALGIAWEALERHEQYGDWYAKDIAIDAMRRIEKMGEE